MFESIDKFRKVPNESFLSYVKYNFLFFFALNFRLTYT